MKNIIGKAAIVAAVSATALGLTSRMAMADGFQPYVSVFAGGSLLNNIHGWATTTGGGPFPITTDEKPVLGKALGAPPIPLSTPGTFTSKFGYSFGLAAGGHVSDHLRAEVELSHTHNDLDKFIADTGPVTNLTGSLDATYLLGNLWFDIPTNTQLTPYLGGGIGMGWASVTSSTIGNTTTPAVGPAFQLGGGVAFAINDHVSLDLGYRYKVLTGANFDLGSSLYSITDHSIASHNFNVGLTYKF